MTALRKLTPRGVEILRGALFSLRAGEITNLATDWVEGKDNSEIVVPLVEVQAQDFQTKRAAAEYLYSVLQPLARSGEILADVGLWCWLTIFYFDSVCPPSDSRRRVLADSHYILEASDYKRRYRHFLATPYRLRAEMPDHNRIYLDAPLWVHGEIIEQTMSKLYLLRFPGVREVIDRLYYDEQRGGPKRGLFSKRKEAKPGDLRNRLPLRIDQLQKTYDVAGLSSDQLLSLLGREFDRWKR